MNSVTRGRWASAYWNSDFYLLETSSGYRGGQHLDPKGARHFLATNESDEALGRALLDALAKSRWVLGAPRPESVYPQDVEFDSDLYDYNKIAERYAVWIEDLMTRYGYKTKRALFKKMMNCYVEDKEGVITISPSHHEKLESWGREKMDGIENVVISNNSTSAEIGEALRLAFSRCTG